MKPADFDVHTLGFSSRSWEETVEILRSYNVELLIDIRTLPGSRYAPQFNQENLVRVLPPAGLEYIHLKQLGGLRKPNRNDPTNAGWKNASFRAYADYMQTAEFRAALDELIRLFEGKRSVYVCTEAVFWRCHRSLVSDALSVRGYRPGHIFSATKCEPHRITAFAQVVGLRITYPAIDRAPAQPPRSG